MILDYLYFHMDEEKILDHDGDSTVPVDSDQPVDLNGWLVLFFLSVVWGSSFILIKKGLMAYPPEIMATLRVFIASIAFIPIFILRYKDIDWSKFKYLLVVGMAGTALPSFLFAFAQTKISSSIAGALNSLTPLFVLVLGVLFFKQAYSHSKLLGVMVGLVGAVLLAVFGSGGSFEIESYYVLYIILGTIFYAISANTVHHYLHDMNSVTISAAAFIPLAIPTFLYLLTTDFMDIFQTHPKAMESLMYIILLAMGSTVMASILFFQLVKKTNAIFASLVAYLIPIVALLWGAVDGELITVFHVIGMGLILIGVYITKR